MVQQRRGCRRREDRHRDDDVRSKYLQILRFIQIDARCTGDTTKSAGIAQRRAAQMTRRSRLQNVFPSLLGDPGIGGKLSCSLP